MENEFNMLLKNCEIISKIKMLKNLLIFKFILIKFMEDICNEKYIDIINKNINEF